MCKHTHTHYMLVNKYRRFPAVSETPDAQTDTHTFSPHTDPNKLGKQVFLVSICSSLLGDQFQNPSIALLWMFTSKETPGCVTMLKKKGKRAHVSRKVIAKSLCSLFSKRNSSHNCMLVQAFGHTCCNLWVQIMYIFQDPLYSDNRYIYLLRNDLIIRH